jgi:feruloyl-CoA synthase
VFPNATTCRRAAGLPPDAPIRPALAHECVLERFTAALSSFAAAHAGSSTRVERAMLLAEPPSLDAGEITDKGSLNQTAVLRHRHALVEQLYGASGADLLIDVSPGTAGAS